MKIKAIIIALLLMSATIIFPLSPVLAEEDVPPELTSTVEPLPVVEIDSETEDPIVDIDVPLTIEAELEPEEIVVDIDVPLTVEGELEAEEVVAEPYVPLTPEQNLILALQANLTKLARSYGDERINSIQMNLSQHLLEVEIKPDWYELEESQQDEMAQKLYSQAQKLAFTRLELLNEQGQLIARSPVIGTKMVILDRYQD
ncbi:MAG: hypothetical protein WBA77_24180 [Microcoleaceae cyanobacterium]